MFFKKNKKQSTENTVHIIIKKKIADDTVQIYAEFDAEEIIIDGVRTLFCEDANFREDATVREHPEITEFKDILERANLTTKDAQIKKIREEIIKEEKKLAAEKKNINKTIETETSKKEDNNTIRLNILDEQARIIKLKICENVIKHDGKGSYVIFLPNGKRQYEYMYADGVLFPIKHLVMEHTMYPNEGSMVRIHRSWVSRLAEDLAGTQLDQWGKVWSAIIIIATVAVLIGNIVWSINLASQAREIPEVCGDAMIDVSNQVADIAKSVSVWIPTAQDNVTSRTVVKT